MKMRKMIVMPLSIALVVGAGMLIRSHPSALAHCQIPCGIYDDAARFTLLREHIATVEKSMKLVIELSEEPGKNANQLVRWVMNKEQHADYIADIITAYFLQQRIKPLGSEGGESKEKYLEKLTLCHEILVASMKTKQTTDLEHARKLRSLVDAFEKAYLGEEAGHSH